MHGTSAEMIDNETYEVVSDFPTTVTSNDNSVVINTTVTPTWDWKAKQTNYDLSFACCDELVKACAWAQKWDFMYNILQVDEPLNKTLDCADNKIKIWIDTTWLVNNVYKDCETQAIPNWAQLVTPTNLWQAIQLSDCYKRYDWPDISTANIIANPTACQAKRLWVDISDSAKCSPCRKQIGKQRLWDNFVWTQVAWPIWIWEEKFYMMFEWPAPARVPVNPAIVAVNTNYTHEVTVWWIEYEWWGIKICRDWLYRLSMRWNIEVTRWINWVRVLLFKKTPWSNTIQIMLEDRYSPPSDPNQDWDPRPPHNYKTTAWWWTWLNAWFFDTERLSVSDEDIYELKTWDIVFCGIKVSSVIDDPKYDITKPAEFAVLWKNSIWWWASWDLWFSFYIESIDDIWSIKE